MWQHLNSYHIYIIATILIKSVITQLIGDHVCLEEERYTINVTEFRSRVATVRKYKWCLNVPPRCSYYTTKTINEPNIVEKELIRQVEKCCNGFEQVENSCISPCPECANGRCEDRVCVCYPGFKGSNCNSVCETDRWGSNCTNQCECVHGRCSRTTGFCDCKPGWNGTRCDLECPGGYFGPFCTEMCKCKKNEVCNVENGDCTQLSTTTATTTLSDTENVKKIHLRNRNSTETPAFATTPHVDLSTKSSNVITHQTNGRFEFSTIQINQNLDVSTIYQTSTEKTTRTTSLAVHDDDTTNPSANFTFITEARNYLADETHEMINDINSQDISNISLSEIGIIAACGVFLIIIIILLISIRKYRINKKESRKSSMEMRTNVEKTAYRESIFHTPLPEPPPPAFSNPSYTSSSSPLGEPTQTTLHNINFHNQTEKDCRKYLYDHPPSTGSYRAVSLPDPEEIDLRLNTGTPVRMEPVYDEIPNTFSPELDNSGTIYMNTFGKTKF